MTNIEAIKAKMVPYELPEDTLQILLAEQGLQPLDGFGIELLPAIKRATIEGLYQCMTLTEESDNGSKLKYDTDALRDLIDHLKEEEPKRPQQRDMTHYW